ATLVWAPGCDSLQLHSQVPTAHAREALRFVNGPVVFWDLSRVPEHYREGGRTTTSASNRLGDRTEVGVVPVKFRYPLLPAPQRCQSLMGSVGQKLKSGTSPFGWSS
ncbi:unnamed protein product, partial [Staurois parvus]